MRSENYVAFFTICGFFIGMIFSMVKFDSAEAFVLSTLTITLFFYLFIHVILIFFVRSKEMNHTYFEKEDYETFVNLQINEIKEREDKITALLKSIHSVETTENKGA